MDGRLTKLASFFVWESTPCTPLRPLVKFPPLELVYVNIGKVPKNSRDKVICNLRQKIK